MLLYQALTTEPDLQALKERALLAVTGLLTRSSGSPLTWAQVNVGHSVRLPQAPAEHDVEPSARLMRWLEDARVEPTLVTPEEGSDLRCAGWSGLRLLLDITVL